LFLHADIQSAACAGLFDPVEELKLLTMLPDLRSSELTLPKATALSWNVLLLLSYKQEPEGCDNGLLSPDIALAAKLTGLNDACEVIWFCSPRHSTSRLKLLSPFR
jgi:hypothetical protein